MWKLVLLTEFVAAQTTCSVTFSNTGFADFANPCKDIVGTSVNNGASCVASCSDGYVPSQVAVSCDGGADITVGCEIGCPVSAADPDTVTNVCFEDAGQAWVSGNQACTPQCKAGYTATALAACGASDGTADPLQLTCSVATTSCRIRNTNAAGAASTNCASNEAVNYVSSTRVSVLPDTRTCTFQCGTGYKVAGAAATLECSTSSPANKGASTYNDFSCTNTCSVTSSASCSNAASGELPDGATCAYTCPANNVPTQTRAALTCSNIGGVSLTCETGCEIDAPSQNGPAEARCSGDKNWLSKDTECNLACATGNRAYPRKATCTTEGTNVTYNCYAETSCVIKRPANSGGKICNEDAAGLTAGYPYTTIAADATCTTQCDYGYKTSKSTISCGDDNALNAANPADSVFTCASNKCTVAAPSANGPAAETRVKCGTGATAVSRSIVEVDAKDCEFQCASGYTAYPETASCSNDAETLTYHCIKSTSCRIAIPSGDGHQKANCENSDSGEDFNDGVSIIEDGKKCTTQCASGSEPATESITCNSDNSIAKKKDLSFKCEEKESTNSATLGVISALLLLATRL